MKTIKTTEYPSHVDQTPIGRGLVAADNLAEGAVVEHLDGRVVSFSKIPEADIRSAIEIDDDRWIVPVSDAKHINHSCDPNCEERNHRGIALRELAAGEEITLDYDRIACLEEPFPCRCGAASCRGTVRGRVG